MGKFYFFTLLSSAFLVLFSCSMESIQENLEIEGEYGFNFRESRTRWDELKKKHNNSYTYSILEESWIGMGSETTIDVVKGKVVRRAYEAFEISEVDGSKIVTLTYVETSKKDIGKHEQGAPPMLMEELYSSCLSEYLIADPNENKVFFETDAQGVMLLCGYVPHGCQDDCYRGIRISHFEWL